METDTIKNPESAAGILEEKVDFKNFNIPYILNGELYEIKTQDGENVTVKCCNCPPDRVYRGSVRSTGNFHMHIKRRHPNLLSRLHEMKVRALLLRRERLTKAKKPTLRNRIKKEQLPAGDNKGFQESSYPIFTHDSSVDKSVQEPINYSLKEGYNQLDDVEPSSAATSQQTQRGSYDQSEMLIATEIHCDLNASMGCVPQTSYDSSGDNRGSALTVGNNNISLITIVKNEFFPVEQAIDLSVTAGTSSLENMESSPTTTNNTTGHIENNNNISPDPKNFKWEELLFQVEQSLKDIQREMCTRNHIKTNRMLLDLAKFKYLHPGFNYQN